jgi:DNA polymerase III epsilon subunit family exonuclease
LGEYVSSNRYFYAVRESLLPRSLAEITFVVVDLETTGASPKSGAAITEIGAVKIRGGQLLGEFKSFINPLSHIPSYITDLTGITDAMVATAPIIDHALPDFLAFCESDSISVLVAHNAPFDLGFLMAAANDCDLPWPDFFVIDTVRLARAVIARDEIPNCKLSTLAQFFDTEVKPTHRALDDAQTTVDVLYGLLERAGSMGVTTLETLIGLIKQRQSRARGREYGVHWQIKEEFVQWSSTAVEIDSADVSIDDSPQSLE